MKPSRLLHHSNGKPSASKTWAAIANGIVLVKYSLSGLTIGSVTFAAFDGTGAALFLAALNGVYVAREYQEIIKREGGTNDA